VASKKAKTNGHDSTTVEMVDLLRQVVRGIEALAVQGKATNERLDALGEEVRGLRADLKSYQRQTDEQIRTLAHEGADTGGSVVELRERVARLEEAVFKKTGT
jgi:hypothetical protein